MRKFVEILKRKDVGAIGIGAMIVFIAMVLVAGIAASVLIQTSTTLQSQAMTTGQDTTDEVSTGVAVYDISGYAPDSGNIDKMAITVSPRAGSADVDLSQTYLELSDTSCKIIFNYTGKNFVDGSAAGQDDVFGKTIFPVKTRFGVLVANDPDDSCTATNPVINKGDKIYLGIDTSKAFNATAGINTRTDIWGSVQPEIGSPGIISFTSPTAYSTGTNVYDLQ